MAWLAGRSDRLFVLAHGNEVMPYPSSIRYGFRRWLRRRVLASARLVICNSRYTERLVKAACPAARTVTIPLGVDSERFKPTLDARAARDTFGIPKDRRVVLSVSRINAYKGHDMILRALAAVPDAARAKLHYVVAGKGEHLASLRQLACRLGVERHVQWLGYVGEDALPNLYASADLFALCTREDPLERGVEGFGLAFLEAQATGIPVLGTRAGGIPDAVEEGQGGWLIAQEDVQAICDLLHRLAEGDPEFVEQARRGRERALKCSWRAYVARVAEALGAGASCEAQG